MQTLNVEAGRSDAEYKKSRELERAELRSDSQSCANFFFVAAGLAALGTGLLPIKINILVSIGMIDLLTFYGARLGELHPIAVMSLAVLWVLVMVGLGLAARYGQRWAFWAGIVLYGLDAIALIMMFSLWAFGVHAVMIFKWFQGQKALGDMQEVGALAAAAAASQKPQ